LTRFIMHDKNDSVGVAVTDIKAGEVVEGWVMEDDSTVTVTAVSNIPLGHKIAMAPVKAGETIVKYSVNIGKTVQDITVGEHVHIHNLKTARW